jgi:Mg-chelatase subunit ChlD
MTGEKQALTAVALAVMALQFEEDPFGVVAFETEAVTIKRQDERIEAEELIRRFMRVPGRGYTHLEEGLKKALELQSYSLEGHAQGRITTLLLSDGKYTAGRDPIYLAPRFSRLMMIKMGEEQASLGLCRDLARQGGGNLWEVPDLEALPRTLFRVALSIIRG